MNTERNRGVGNIRELGVPPGNASTNTFTVVRTDRMQLRLLEPASGTFVNGPFWARVAPASLDGAGVQSMSINGVAANQIYDGSYAAYITNVSGATQAMSVDVTVNYNNGTSQTVPLAVIEGYELIGEQVSQKTWNVWFTGGPPWCKHWTSPTGAKGEEEFLYHAPATTSELNSFTFNQSWGTASSYCVPDPDPTLVDYPFYSATTNVVHAVGQAGHGQSFGYSYFDTDGHHCWYGDYMFITSQIERSQTTANYFPYEPGTPVIVTFEGLSYAHDPNQPADLEHVTFQGKTPIAVSGNSVSYLVTVPADRTLVIGEGEFEWPEDTWESYHEGCYHTDVWHTNTRSLGFSSWHNQQVKIDFVKFQNKKMGSNWKVIDRDYKFMGVFTYQTDKFGVVPDIPPELPPEKFQWHGIASGSAPEVVVKFSQAGEETIEATVPGSTASGKIKVEDRPTGMTDELFAEQAGNALWTVIARTHNLIGQVGGTLEPWVWAEEAYPVDGGQLNTKQDAARHTYWGCLLVRYTTTTYAEGILRGHEVSNAGPSTETVMDLYNDVVGMGLAASHTHSLGNSCCRTAVQGAMSSGKCVYLDSSYGVANTAEDALLQPTDK